MATNRQPIFVSTPKTSIALSGTAANTAYDGTGTVVTLMTAPTDGCFLERVRIKPLGTNVATVMRFFVNNGSTNATAANNSLFTEITLPATTGIQTASLPEYDVPFNLKVQGGFRIMVTIGTAVANGFALTAECGDYTG